MAVPGGIFGADIHSQVELGIDSGVSHAQGASLGNTLGGDSCFDVAVIQLGIWVSK